MEKHIKKIDARKQSREDLYKRRKQVIGLYLDNVPVMQIVERSGLSWFAVTTAIKLFKEEGELALKPAARGRKQGTGRMLSEKQASEIRELIRTKRPWKCGLKDSLWNRDLVMQLVEQQFGLKLSERGLGGYLKRWGLTLRNPSKRGYKRCSNKVQKWLDVHYTEIEQQAREKEAEIYWANKPMVVDADAWCQINTQKNQTAGGRRQKISMISFVSNQGKVRWVINKGRFDSDRQIKLIAALIKDTRKKVLFLIRSDWDIYRSQKFMAWVRQNKDKIKVFPDNHSP